MLKFATYNVLHAYHRDKIVANIKLLVEKEADILCIQEAELPIENILSPNWQVEYFFTTERGCRLAVAWNKSKLNLIDTKKILLPALTKPDLMQKLTGYKTEKIQRGAFIANFSSRGKVVKIINAHLAWEGGTSNRLNQLRHLLTQLGDNNSSYEILAGDFNTFVPALFRRTQESKIEKVLGTSWTNVLPDLAWSCDISYTDPQDGFETFSKICKTFGIKLQSRLDYIFARNLKIISSEMLDLPGSDHRPLIATFEI